MKSAELRAIEQAMSDAPWSATHHGSIGPCDYVLDGPDMSLPYCEQNDAIGITALRNAAPVLISIASAVEAWCEAECDRDYLSVITEDDNYCIDGVHCEQCSLEIARLAVVAANQRREELK